jgi:hypothetical protein
MTKKTKKQKEDEAMEALLKKIPKGETMIITEDKDGKITIVVTQTLSYII